MLLNSPRNKMQYDPSYCKMLPLKAKALSPFNLNCIFLGFQVNQTE